MRPVGAFGVVLATLLVAALPARAWDVADLFQRGAPLEQPAATALLDRARENLYGADGERTVEITREDRAGRVERQTFVVLQRTIGQTRRIVTEQLGVKGPASGRVLQIEEPGGETRAYAFVRAPGARPFPTTFRLADPFLCTWYDSAEAGAEPPPGATQILSRRPGRIRTDRVHWLTVEPAALRRFHHSELAIADSDGAILQYRHFERQNDAKPALVVRLPRARMVERDGRVLPESIVYEYGTGEKIRIEIEHRPLRPELGVDAFSPERFHMAPLELPGAADPPARAE